MYEFIKELEYSQNMKILHVNMINV